MVDHLAKLIPSFHGADSQTQCFPHTVNLIVKASIIPWFIINSN